MAYAYIAFVLLLVFFGFYCARRWNRYPLPPGSKGRFPFLGMTFDMPMKRPELTMTKWALEYGPLVHVRVGLQHHMIINDAQIGKDLLEKKKYSARPPTVVGEIISGSRRAVLIPYGPHWRRIRRIYTSILMPQKCDKYLPIQESESVATLQNLRTNSDNFLQELHRYSLSVARSVAFGRRAQSFEEPITKDIMNNMIEFSDIMTPGRYTIESTPILKYLPKWMQPVRKYLENFRDEEIALVLRCYNTALEDSAKHPDRPSLVRDIHKEMEAAGEVEDLQAAAICMEVLAAGSDTTATSLSSFVHACVAYPDAIKRAQEELDRVIGRNRFPTWNDQADLPYVRAMIKEQHRWRSIAPLGFFRWSDEEDVVNGYRIPKDAMIRINNRAIHMDPDRYPDPQHFVPERFLNHPLSAAEYVAGPNVAERDHFSYGFGRRTCPGMHLAERSLFNMVARLLHTFDIKHALDENGEEIPVDVNAYRTTLILGPEPFKARFEVRNKEIEVLLEREWQSRFGNGPVESWIV